MKRAMILGVCLLALGACGGSDDSSDTTAGELRPAAEVTGDRIAEQAMQVGETAKIDDVSVTITSIVAAADEYGFRLAVTAHAENATEEDLQTPAFRIGCAGSDERGEFQADSDWAWWEPVPAGSYIDGTQYLLIPGDDRITGEAVPACADPAFVVTERQVTMDDDPVYAWAIPAGIVPTEATVSP
jgi:hypothetical protein